MAVEFDELPGWRFETDEVSACVYKVTGADCQGRNVEATGTEPNALLNQCRQSALEILERDRIQRNQR